MGINSIKIIIPGTPIPKARPRFTVMKGQKGKFFPKVYSSQGKEVEQVKKCMLDQLADILEVGDKRYSIKMNRILMGRAVSVRLSFFFTSKTASYWNDTYHTLKPDLDNLEKFYLDCANGILFYDDKQVVEMCSKKKFSKVARTEIEIMQKDPEKVHKKSSQILKIIEADALSELVNDADEIKKTLEFILEEGKYHEDLKGPLLNQLACNLGKFAVKYTPFLAKIGKIGDFSAELEDYERGLKRGFDGECV
jgi:hypothetical protein